MSEQLVEEFNNFLASGREPPMHVMDQDPTVAYFEIPDEEVDEIVSALFLKKADPPSLRLLR